MLGLGKVPWITERDIWKTLPKTSRVPTGGWRGMGAVPSHSYPAPATLPNGYWAGLGLTPSVHDAQCQGAKTLQGWGADATATQTAPPTEASWTSSLEAIAKAGTDAYTAYLTSQAQADAIKAGVPVAAFQQAPTGTAMPPRQTGGQSNTLLLVGVAAGLGVLGLLFLRR